MVKWNRQNRLNIDISPVRNYVAADARRTDVQPHSLVQLTERQQKSNEKNKK